MTFPLGRVLATPGALDALGDSGETTDMLLTRHAHEDWGDVDGYDWKANDEALVRGLRLLSAYTLRSGVKVWLITEADHSATTLLLPNEY